MSDALAVERALRARRFAREAGGWGLTFTSAAAVALLAATFTLPAAGGGLLAFAFLAWDLGAATGFAVAWEAGTLKFGRRAPR